jgi:predicted Zn-dependent protease with MMP-like domain
MNFEVLVAAAEGEVSRVLAELPPEIRTRADQLSVFFERVPDESDLALGIEADTLGYFDEGGDFTAVPRMRLWLKNIEEFAAETGAEFLDEVRITYLHELGHFLGWDEEEIDERGLG